MSKIYTKSGAYLDYLNPWDHDYSVQDIATALSHINRFAGHTERPYSVAHHSVLVSHLVPQQYALQGLMHDAAEAYVGDLMTPLKQLLPRYSDFEDAIQGAIMAQFGIEDIGAAEVHHADRAALLAEKWQILGCYDPWDTIPDDVPVIEADIRPKSNNPRVAAAAFLKRYEELRA